MRIVLVLGTRPEVIKMAPVYLALQKNHHSVSLITTGQHTDLLENSLKDFGLHADHALKIESVEKSFSDVSSELLPKLTKLFVQINPDIVLVHGDTNSAVLGALTSFHLRIPVGHVEAGLRTESILEPWPEEGNRRIIDAISTHKFAPTNLAFQRLQNESGSEMGVYMTGNTVVDSLGLLRINSAQTTVAEKLKVEMPSVFDQPYILLTQHRRESFGEPMRNVFKACLRLARESDVNIVFPLHPNPIVGQIALEVFNDDHHIKIIRPLDYPEMISTIIGSEFIITDSGGLQEEAPYLNKFVLVTRDVTERTEAIISLNARLVGTDIDSILESSRETLKNPQAFMASRIPNPFGNEGASQKIADIISAIGIH